MYMSSVCQDPNLYFNIIFAGKKIKDKHSLITRLDDKKRGK